MKKQIIKKRKRRTKVKVEGDVELLVVNRKLIAIERLQGLATKRKN